MKMLLSILLVILIVHQLYGQWSFENCRFANDECPNADIQFWLYKNETIAEPLLWNNTADMLGDFAAHRPLKVIIHGFNGSHSGQPNSDVLAPLLLTEQVNVISVDYAALVQFPCYAPWALQNAPIVAKCLAKLLNELLDHRALAAKDIHLIGFSLGAQIAGLTANHIPHTIGRITGLDPARPGFMTYNLTEKLDTTDAAFVDVLHTDPFLFSFLTPIGHADFYPNLKKFQQPGCSYEEDGRFRNCNHFRASLYYAESIVSRRGFWAFNCGHWWDYFMDMCMKYRDIPFTRMGHWVDLNATGSYFLTTNASPPFAQGPALEFEFESTNRTRASKEREN